MGISHQLHNLESGIIQPPPPAAASTLMYVANSSLATTVGFIGLHDNISIADFDDILDSPNRSATTIIPSSSPTSSSSFIPLVGGLGRNDSEQHGGGYYNESGAATEWMHFYDLMLSWQGICLITVFCTFIVITVIGNTLIILAVITTRRLRTVTNCFVMSLAVADLLVGIFVMPPAVAVHLIGSWQLGWVLCDIWISLDVLLCTASILSLCAISVDRYLAVTRPLTYSRKRRSKRLALIMILIVWLLALAITCPPILGWYEPGRRDLSECRYNQNEGYVIFSAMGSFFIPMAVMIYVYARISCVVASRHDNMTDISVHNKKFKRYTAADVENDIDAEPDYSEMEPQGGTGSGGGGGQKPKQTTSMAATRSFSNHTIAKELHEIMLSDSDNCSVTMAPPIAVSPTTTTTATPPTTTATHCHSLLALPPPPAPPSSASTSSSRGGPRNGCYELTRPASLKRSSANSLTSTTMTSGMGPGSSLLEAHWQQQPQSQQQQQQQPSRTHSFRHSHLSLGGGGGGAGSVGLRHHHHHHHHHHFSSGATATSTTTSMTMASGTVTGGTGTGTSGIGTSKSLSNRITSLKKENKTTQTLSIVVGGFIACWLPFFVYYLITPFLAAHQVSRTLAKVLTWLGWFNSAINPFIYAFYSVDFRAAFWRLTCKRFFSGNQKPQFPTNTMSIRR